MDDAKARVRALSIALFRRVYRKCREIAAAEITSSFGQAWRGGRYQWPYQLPGYGYELVQGDVGTVSVGANSDTGTMAVSFDINRPYPATALTAGASSGTSVLTVAATAPFLPGEIVTISQIGGSHLSERQTIASINATAGTITVAGTLAHTYGGGDAVEVLPVVQVSSSDVGWVPSYSALTAGGFTLTLARRIPLSNPETGSVPTTTMGSGSSSATQTVTFPQAFQSAPVVDVQVTAISGTGGIGDYVGIATAFHTDGSGNIDSCTITFTYRPTAGAGNTGYATTGLTVDTIAVHRHDITNPGTDIQTQDAGAHAHGLTEATSGGNTGHHHVLAAGSVGTNTDIDATYAAFGTRAAPAVDKDASWLAFGVQAPPT